jgi:hypothetical protein
MIGLYLHHQGSGHRTRGAQIARELETLAPGGVTGLGTGPAPPAWPGGWLELARDDDPVPLRTGPEHADVAASGVLHWAPRQHPGLLRRHEQVVSWLALERPSAVVVDVSVEIALLVRLCGIPVVVTALPGERWDRPHRTAYDLADHLLATWPAGTHDREWPESWRAKTWHVGPLSRFADRVPPPVRRTPQRPRRVLVLWGEGGTDVTPDELARARAATPGWRWTVVGGAHPPAVDLWAELGEADVVVTHAGQNAVADVAAARRPAVVVAQRRPFGEQEATARAVRRLGVAEGLPAWPQAQEWGHVLDSALARGGQGWARWQQPGAAADAAHLLHRTYATPHLQETR